MSYLQDLGLPMGRVPLVLWTIFIFIVAVSAIRKYLAWSRLRHVPGPRFASVSNLWLLRVVLGGRMPEILHDVCETYGTLSRIGPNDILCSDPDVIRRMSTAKSKYRKSKFYNSFAFNPDRDTMLSTTDENYHADLKTKTAAAYSGKEVENLEQSIDTQVGAFIYLIERKYLSTPTNFRPIDFAQTIQYFTLDTITEIAFGKPFGCLERDGDVHDYIKKIDDILPAAMVAAIYPWMVTLSRSFIFRRFLPTEQDKLGFGKLIQISKDLVAERYGTSRKIQKDMLGSFVAHGLTEEQACSEALLQVAAGTDTTAAALRAILLYIITSPSCYTALQAAIDEAIKEGKISSPVTDAEARAIPYLQAVIKEGLRIRPAIGGILPKVVPEGGELINGYHIPGGTNISLCPNAITRSKATYGPDADLFRPERWLEVKDPDRLRKMTSTADLVWGSGKWACSGKNIAMMEMNKVLVELFRRFDISLVNPANPWKSFSAASYVQSDMFVRFSDRAR